MGQTADVSSASSVEPVGSGPSWKSARGEPIAVQRPVTASLVRPADGVTLPQLLYKHDPQYTPEAMRARVQGVVTLQIVVGPDGKVSNAVVARSLDSKLGLDDEALRAARQWRFTPGLRMGEPAPVLLTIEITFRLRN